MNWFKDHKSACGLLEGNRGPSPEDDDGDKDDKSGDSERY